MAKHIPINSKHSLFRSTFRHHFTDDEYDELFEEERHRWVDAGYCVEDSKNSAEYKHNRKPIKWTDDDFPPLDKKE
jgi:hypothetical protein